MHIIKVVKGKNKKKGLIKCISTIYFYDAIHQKIKNLSQYQPSFYELIEVVVTYVVGVLFSSILNKLIGCYTFEGKS